ncbi:hypothetical protein O0L34_g2615 [Tuta absoluta]|nr:hypothetical protein O0L34_g2615 [Tuta absoluta]
MPRVLNHLNSAKGKFIVIAPNWNQCSWLPDLKSRALEEPIAIPALHKNLLDLTTDMNPPQIDNLQLLAWKIGGGPIRLSSGQAKIISKKLERINSSNIQCSYKKMDKVVQY